MVSLKSHWPCMVHAKAAMERLIPLVNHSCFHHRDTSDERLLTAAERVHVSTTVRRTCTGMSRGRMSPQAISCIVGAQDGPRKTVVYEKNAVVGKVVQSSASVAWLLRRPNGEMFLLSAPIPAPLVVVDTTTGETVRKCVDIVWDLPHVKNVCARFPQKVHMTCNDSAGCNIRCEDSFVHNASNDGPSDIRLRIPCQVHKVHTCQGGQFALVSEEISGVISFGLTMRAGGALQKLRKCLVLLFARRLRIFRGAFPPGPASCEAQLMESVLNLYLSPATHGPLGIRRQLILRRMINGDITQEQVQHYCPPGCCASVEETRSLFSNEVVDALLPHIAPVFPRHRWVGSNFALDYIGLLASVHRLLEGLVPPWIRELKNSYLPAVPSDFDLTSVDADDHDLVSGPLALEDIGQRQDGAEQGESSIVQAHDSRTSYAEFNARQQRNINTFARARRSPELVVMRRCLGLTLTHLMEPLLDMAGKDWVTRQWAAVDAGREVAVPPLLQCATGALCAPYFTAFGQVVSDSGAWSAVPHSNRTLRISTLAFRLLARGAGAVEALLAGPHTRYPWRLFLVLSSDEATRQAVAQDPECVLDTFARQVRQHFPGDAVLSQECANHLKGCLHLMGLDIVRVEARHATLRRVCARSVQTYKKTVRDLSGDLLLLFQRLLQRGPFEHRQKPRQGQKRPHSSAASDAPQTHQAKRKRDRLRLRSRQDQGLAPRRGISTAWGMYISEQLRGGGGLPSPKRRARLRSDYRRLPAEDKKRLRLAARRKTLIQRSRLHRSCRRFPHPPCTGDGALALLPAVGKPLDHSGLLQMALHADVLPLAETLRVVRVAARQASSRKQAVNLQEILHLQRRSKACLATDSLAKKVAGQAGGVDALTVAAGGDFLLFQWNTDVRELVLRVLERAKPDARAAFVQAWEERMRVVHHRDCQPLQVPPPPPRIVLRVGGSVHVQRGWQSAQEFL